MIKLKHIYSFGRKSTKLLFNCLSSHLKNAFKDGLGNSAFAPLIHKRRCLHCRAVTCMLLGRISRDFVPRNMPIREAY